MSQNSAKRPRTDEDGNSTLKDIKDEEIWMSDGNIIIAVVDEAQNERHLFKCHRSVLSSRLPVLKEMFEADQLSGASTTLASEHYEGIPIVRLFDEPQDVRQLLGIFYNPSKLPYKWYMRSTMAGLGGLMRLSKKYEAEDIYKHCVTIFQKAWPATLQDWDLRETHVKLIWQEDRHREADYKEWYESEEYDLPEPGAAVILAYEHGLLSSCAGAFYVLDREYRTPNHFRECGEDNAFPHQLPVEIKGLSDDLLQKFIIGREFLRYTGLELLTRALPTTTAAIPSKHCRAQGDLSCRKELEAWWKDRLLWELNTNRKHSTDPLGMLDDLANFIEKSKSINKICILCGMELRAQLLDTRQYLWDMLPAFYGIKAFGDIQHEPHIEPLVTELDKYLDY